METACLHTRSVYTSGSRSSAVSSLSGASGEQQVQRRRTGRLWLTSWVVRSLTHFSEARLLLVMTHSLFFKADGSDREDRGSVEVKYMPSFLFVDPPRWSANVPDTIIYPKGRVFFAFIYIVIVHPPPKPFPKRAASKTQSITPALIGG